MSSGLTNPKKWNNVIIPMRPSTQLPTNYPINSKNQISHLQNLLNETTKKKRKERHWQVPKGSDGREIVSSGPHLQQLSNNFSVAIPSFGNCLALEHLDISANKFSGDVAGALSLCDHRPFLNISSNRFPFPRSRWRICATSTSPETDSRAKFPLGRAMFIGSIPASLHNCSQLVLLDLSFNYLIIPTNRTPDQRFFPRYCALKIRRVQLFRKHTNENCF